MKAELGYWLVRGSGFIFGCFANLFYMIAYSGKYRSSLGCAIDGWPRIIIRNNGAITLSNLKSRSGLKIFSDGGHIHIGKNVFFNNDCSINSMSQISIGEETIFGESVKIYDHNHLIIGGKVMHEQFKKAEVTIGKNCWFGSNVVILPGVSICDNVTVGAGAIVSKSIDTPGIYVADLTLRKLSQPGN